eukprot:TRINITY_DN12627_c0_g1_i2.p1 TRINITY_DN12627_c0_g1~~TRINITY_DN12627_c0_g1_i2.p1  ORF type:complete len:287 (+),score=66.95 TRINITY_DN12627_c0_g1_i2:40-861(+)
MSKALYPMIRGYSNVNERKMMTILMRRTRAAMPMLGLDTTGMDNPVPAVERALDIGYRRFHVGEGHESALGELFYNRLDNGAIERKSLWVDVKTTDDWDRAEEVITEKLEKLRTGYLDMVFAKCPIREQDNGRWESKEFQKLWGKLFSLTPPKGRITRHVGICHVSRKKLELDFLRTMSHEIPDAIQNEVHLQLQMNGLRTSCQRYDVRMLGEAICPKSVTDVKMVQQACHSKSLTPEQLSIKWSIQRQVPCLVSTENPDELLQAFIAATTGL